MRQEAFLLGIAQVAVTLAGFSGLVVAVRGAAPARWHARDIWSLAWMLGTSLGALFLALLPLVLSLFRLPESALWSNPAWSPGTRSLRRVNEAMRRTYLTHGSGDNFVFAAIPDLEKVCAERAVKFTVNPPAYL